MKIFLAAFPAPGWGPHDVIGTSLCEDGTGLAEHLSSNIAFSKHDMGLTSDWHHDTYQKHCPDGFELVWIDDPATSEDWQAALAKNKANAARVQDSAEQSLTGSGPRGPVA